MSLSWKFVAGLILIGLSLALGFIHYLVFQNSRDLVFNIALNIVFIPIQVLLVTLIIEKLLSDRERLAMLRKAHMLIGAFFSEIGDDLLKEFNGFCADSALLSRSLRVYQDWAPKDYRLALKATQAAALDLNPSSRQLAKLRQSLLAKREFILGLIQNPNQQEHEAFTDLLLAVNHLTEELFVRKNFGASDSPDMKHLRNDMVRAYKILIREWLGHLAHLKTNYPYIFSLMVRLNPFVQEASPVIKK